MNRYIVSEVINSTNAVRVEDGEMLAKTILPSLLEGKEPILDFEGLTLLITGFFNGFFFELLSSNNGEILVNRIQYQNLKEIDHNTLELSKKRAVLAVTRPEEYANYLKNLLDDEGN